jgi:hypothetical protein
MKVEVFAPGDIIFKEGELSFVIYYLCSGKVQIYHEDTKTVFKDIKQAKYFGEIAFFLSRPRTASALSLQFSEFLTLERAALFNVLTARPKEMEITNVIIHNTEKYKNLSLLGVRCYLGRKMGHVAKNCTEFKYIFDKEKAVSRASAKKHNQRSVNLNSSAASKFNRAERVSNVFQRYDVYSTKGKAFTPGIKYVNNKRIISRAWSMQGKANKVLRLDNLSSIKEISNDSDSDILSESSMKESLASNDSSFSDKTFTFGRPRMPNV